MDKNDRLIGPSLRMVITIAVFWASLCAASMEYYVSTDGCDSNSGTIKHPFASIEKARDVVRSLSESQKSQGVTVFIRGGIYVITEPIVFNVEDSAAPGSHIKYTAYEEEIPVITSSKPLTGFRRLEEGVSDLPSVASGNVWVADVGEGTDFKALYIDGKMLQRARSNGFIPVSRGYEASTKKVTVPEDFPLTKLKNDHDLELLIRPTFAWSMNILPIADIDLQTRTVHTTVGGTYNLEPQPQWSIDAHGIEETAWFENSLEFFDQPGSWVLNSSKGKLYLWPENDREPKNVTFPTSVELIRVEGKIHKDQPSDVPVRGLVFENITFTGNDRYTWEDQEPSFQHDWSSVDQPNAMLRLRGAEDCVIRGCVFIHGATAGVRLDLYAINNLIEGNRFGYLGEHGIALCGYGPGTKDVNRFNTINNNRIHHVGRLYWYGSGIYVSQSGDNVISNNLIHNVPFIGITVSGARDFNYQSPRHGEGYRSIRWNEISPKHRKLLQDAYSRKHELTDLFLAYLHARNNLIKANEIFAAVEKMGDGNAIYLSGAGTGNFVQKNYIHNIFSSGIQTALRPDDLQKQTLFSDNIIYRSVYGAVEHKHSNDYINNIFASIYPTNIYGREWKAWAYFIFGRGPNTGSRIQRNIFVNHIDVAPRFYYNRPNSPMEDSIIDNNLYFCKEYPEIVKQQFNAMRDAGHDKNSVVEDPMFKDIKVGNFLLKPNSAAFSIGFRPIDTTEIGLQSPWRETLIEEDLINTKIYPSSHYIEKDETYTVIIKSDRADAVIRYTADGSEPTNKSPIYESPLEFDEPVYIRAKSFKDGFKDLYGAAEFYAIMQQ